MSCINLVEINGAQNVTSGVTQQCGPVTNMKGGVESHPILAAAAFIIFLVLAMLLSITPTAPTAGTDAAAADTDAAAAGADAASDQ